MELGGSSRARGNWQVGLLQLAPGDTSLVHMVIVDGVTGTREEWIERTWDRDVEGLAY